MIQTHPTGFGFSMSSDTSTLKKSYRAPWTLSAFNALPGNPVSIGVLFTIALLIVFFAGRALANFGGDSAPGDLRIAVTQILITAYSATRICLPVNQYSRDDPGPVLCCQGDTKLRVFRGSSRQASLVASTTARRFGLPAYWYTGHSCNDTASDRSLGLADLELRRLLAPTDNGVFRLVDELFLLRDRCRVRQTFEIVEQISVAGPVEFGSLSPTGAPGLDKRSTGYRHGVGSFATGSRIPLFCRFGRLLGRVYPIGVDRNDAALAGHSSHDQKDKTARASLV